MNTPFSSPANPRLRPAYVLVTLTLVSALALVALLPGSPASRAVVRAQNPEPTPLPTSTYSQVPAIAPGVPRPEPVGIVHTEGSGMNCVQNAPGEMGEAAIAGVMVRLKDGSGTVLRRQLTNASGIFDLYDANVSLAQGSYTLDVVLSGTNWSFACGQPGTDQSVVYSSPVDIASPGDYPGDMLVNIGVQ